MLKSVYAGLMRSKLGFAGLLVFFSIMAMSLAVENTAQAYTTPKIAGGDAHTVALKSDGTVWAWGGNYTGQLGDGTTTDRTTPMQVSGLRDIAAIAAGAWHTITLKSDGTVWAWGNNGNGQLGDGTTTQRNTPVQISGLSGVTAIDGEYYHTLALKSDGTVWVWGFNGYGQLGDGTTTNRNTPVQVSGLSGVIAIAGGYSHTLALKSDGTVWAWGYNYYGQLGDATTIQRNTPVQVSGLSGVIAIAGGAYHTVALKSDGTVWAWGYNYYGQLGDATTIQRNTPVQVSGLSGVIAIAGGENYTIALKSDGTVWAGGSNGDGQLGDGSTTNRITPVQVSILSGVIAVDAGHNHSLAVKSDGTVCAWGKNLNGQLGDGTTTIRSTPVQSSNFNLGSLPSKIAGGENHTIALKSDGTVWGWGYNTFGELGNGTLMASGIPVQASTVRDAVTIVSGRNHVLALKSDGIVLSWGRNSWGQLGDGTTISRTSPVQISTISNVVSIASGSEHSLALKSDGTVWAWGLNRFGQLGNGTTTNSATPVQVIGLSNIVFITCGYEYNLAIKSDGTVWAWGYNQVGELGDGTTTNRSIPVQTTGISNIIEIACGTDHSLALKSDGTVWAWGLNGHGQLGNGSTTSYYTPSQSTNLSGIIAIAAKGAHSLAIKSDGTVWAWGYNGYGQLGDGTTTTRTTPVKVNNLINIVTIAGGYGHSIALQANGSVWAWGQNNYGQLGDGTTTDSSTPVQVNWSGSTIAQKPTVSTGMATNVAANSATLNGTVNANGTSTTTWFNYGTSSGYYNGTSTTQLVSGTSTTSVTTGISGLSASKTYYYRIAASNSAGTSYGSETTFVTAPTTPIQKPTVTTGTATSIGSSTATLNGTVNANGTSTAAWFNYGTASGNYTGTSTTQLVMGTSTTPVAINIGSLNASTTYYYRIAASNTGGASYGSETTFATLSSDITPPTIVSTSPSSVATNVAVNVGSITATFSEAMNIGTIGTSTFRVSTGSTTVNGSVASYNFGGLGSSTTAGFTPSSALSYSTTYTAMITTGVKDTAGNAMSSNYSWSFTTTAPPNTAPVANAGAGQFVNVGSTVTLNGSASSDPDAQYGDAITYSWSMSSKPTGSTATLTNPTSANPTFVADKAGTYMVSLTVSDNGGLTNTATVTITTINRAPVANAGAAPSVYVGGTATLDGSASSDPDGDTITYSWSMSSRPADSAATLTNPTSANPAFVADKAGTYVVELTVIDNGGFANTVTVTIRTNNRAPVANAGAAPSVYVGGTATLDGSASSDQDGDAITYSWSMNSKPVDSTATLTNPTSANPTFVADKAGEYTVELTVSDGVLSSTATLNITTTNSAPVANAGPAQTVYVGNTVTLDGSGSYDVDGNLLTFNWVLTTVPTDSRAELSVTTSVNPTFTVDKPGTYVVSLTVNDGTADSAATTVTISTRNSAPVANAGADQSAYVNNTVTLDGSLSHDVDGDLLTYSWELTTVPTGSGAALGDATAVNPTFIVDKSGTYVVSLMVNDGTEDSVADTVTISTLNSAPVANAGADQSPHVNDMVTLDGSLSHDVDGNQLTYRWAFTTIPTGSNATLSDVTAVKPTFTVDKSGTYVVSLIVNDGELDSTTADTVTISTLNSAPVANAGADQSPHVNDTVTLDGSKSTDVDGNQLTYSWAFTTMPTGSSATLSGDTAVNPTFTVDKPGTYVVSLMVNDGELNSEVDTIIISTLNSAPVANAGADQSPYVNETVTLDGSKSTDVDGNQLTYSWAFTARPQDSAATLSNVTAVNPAFMIDKPGTYVVSLIVNDGELNSTTADTVTITTLNSAPVANAGADQSPYVNDTVTLDGSKSTDVDGNQLTYTWAFTTRPEGSTATLSDVAAVNPTFTVDKSGTYVVSLTVNDGELSSTIADTITISTFNSPPVANAGADQTPYVNNTVTLDGSKSTDVDGNQLTYKWAFTTKPQESAATLSGDTTVNPTFTVDKSGTYVVSLTVNDGELNSTTADTITISTLNSAPVANAGADKSAYVNDTVTLDGSGSTDVDGNLLTYKWAFTTVPSGSNAALSDTTAVNPTFTVDKSGTYVVSLTVNDGELNSTTADTVTISTLNSAPVANAGADQTPYVNNTVTLDGSQSTDVDGNQLTYSWAFTTRPEGSNAALSDASAVNPTFTVDKSGTYVLSLTVNDGTVDSAADTVTISTLNSAPVANAGADKSAYVNDTVTLDGSGSTDVDGNLLTYKWAFTTVPSGSNTALSDTAAVKPTFMVDAAGTYVVSLTVNDGTVDSPVDTVTITTLNSVPVASAGSDQSLYVGNTVTLDGSGSHDVDGNQLTYSWAFTTKPQNSTATLSDATAVSPTFTIDKAGTYVVSLTVNDGAVDSQPDTVTISTINVAPVADAGADQSVNMGDTVTLDGSGSTDADGNSLTYIWAFTTKPSGSSATLDNPVSVNPAFTPDVEGTYVVSLIVNDGTVNSAPDTVTITAKVIEAEVDIKPETINLREKGKCKAFIELPAPYTGSDVVVSSVECQGAYAIQGRVDDEGRFIATFNVKDLNVETQSRKEEVIFTVSGELKDGAKFQGSDTVKVKNKEKEKEKGKDKDK